MTKILLVEDEESFREGLAFMLSKEGYEVITAENGNSAISEFEQKGADLVLLDVMLPGLSGLEVCKKLRSMTKVPIIMLTAKDTELDKVLGLEIGADDYITKPFSSRELLARVKAMFRFREMLEESLEVSNSIINKNHLTIDIEKRKVTIKDQKIDLTPKEYELLVLMASNPGKKYSRADLLTLIWGYDFDGYDHTINSTINRLRNKIEPSLDDPIYIKTIWGVGYYFNDEL